MAHEIQVRVGRRIAQARDEAVPRLSQRELALAVGHAVRTIQTWEAGQRHPRVDALAQIAKATGRPVSWFYADGDGQVPA